MYGGWFDGGGGEATAAGGGLGKGGGGGGGERFGDSTAAGGGEGVAAVGGGNGSGLEKRHVSNGAAPPHTAQSQAHSENRVPTGYLVSSRPQLAVAVHEPPHQSAHASVNSWQSSIPARHSNRESGPQAAPPPPPAPHSGVSPHMIGGSQWAAA